MSVRFGVSLIPEPTLAARLHRARQVICSQYGCWAAEMHPVHLPLFSYFAGAEAAVSQVNDRLSDLVGQFRARGAVVPLLCRGITLDEAAQGGIFLEFAAGDATAETEPAAGPPRSNGLQRLAESVRQTLEQHNLSAPLEPGLRFGLLQHAGLKPAVFESAAGFASALIEGLELPGYSCLWEMALIRFQSEAVAAAVDETGWRSGGWASDLRWQFVGCYPMVDRPG